MFVLVLGTGEDGASGAATCSEAGVRRRGARWLLDPRTSVASAVSGAAFLGRPLGFCEVCCFPCVAFLVDFLDCGIFELRDVKKDMRDADMMAAAADMFEFRIREGHVTHGGWHWYLSPPVVIREN